MDKRQRQLSALKRLTRGATIASRARMAHGFDGIVINRVLHGSYILIRCFLVSSP
jgi:hypothetical protein